MTINHFEPSRHLADFHLAGFTYYDGLSVIDELTLGQTVTLKAEPDNPHDGDAVVIFYKNAKLGYVPEAKNALLSRLLYFGYGEFLEAKIQLVDTTNHPERQFRVVVSLKDRRKSSGV